MYLFIFKLMKKQIYSALVFVLTLLTLIFPLKINAVSVSPNSGSYVPSAQLSINVTAAPTGAGSNAVAIRLSLVNATVVSFTPASGGSWIGATQDCAGPAYFTSTTVCASLAKGSAITAGETLGTLVIQLSSSTGTATITKTSGNAYSDGSSTFADTGTAATFTISASGSTGNSLPNTAIGDPTSFLPLTLGALLIVWGIYFNKSLKNYKLKPIKRF